MEAQILLQVILMVGLMVNTVTHFREDAVDYVKEGVADIYEIGEEVVNETFNTLVGWGEDAFEFGQEAVNDVIEWGETTFEISRRHSMKVLDGLWILVKKYGMKRQIL